MTASGAPSLPPQPAGAQPVSAVSARAKAERRHLTIVFSDISGSTRLSAEMEPEIYAELLHELRTLFERIVARHGGEIVRIDGDGAIFLFGHVTAHEDAGRRATEAALDLHDAAATLDRHYGLAGQNIRLHTGIHSGVVLLQPGDVVRGKFEMLGDATNVASRLCELAASDQILVSDATLGADRHFFRTGPRQDAEIRGTARRLGVYAVTGREHTETRFAARAKRGLTPFAGRRVELARLRAALDGAALGQSIAGDSGEGAVRLSIVAGPAGIGKTRLVNEFLDEAADQGATIHHGYCEAYLGARPFQPFAQFAAAIGAELDADYDAAPDAPEPDDARAILHRLAGRAARVDTEAAPLQPEQIVAALASALRLLTGPVILWIDDWQWADDASRAVLNGLLQQGGQALLILLTTRGFDAVQAELSAADIIELQGLNAVEMAAAIEGIRTSLPPFVVDRICDAAGGNPLFIEELCHDAALGEDGQGLVGKGDRNGWLDTLIQSRFARLPEDAAVLVKAASVLGTVFPAWLFEAMTGVEPDASALKQLMAEDFIYPGDVAGTLRFKHGLTRDAIYQMIGLAERRDLHGRIVTALHRAEGGADAHHEALAYHYAEGGNADRAAHYAVLAGDSALASSALDRAQAQYRAALEALDRLARTVPEDAGQARLRMQIVRKFGMACVVDPARDQLPILERAATDAQATGDQKALAWAEYWLGFILYGLGEARASLEHFRVSLTAADASGERRMALQIPANLGQAHATACDYGPALTLLDSAIATMAASPPAIGNAALSHAYSLSCRGFVRADMGAFAAAYDDFDAAIAVLGPAEHEMTASVLTMRSASLLWQGDYAQALHYAGEGRRVAERVKARYLFAMARALGAFARWKMDGDVGAVEVIRSATAWLEASASQQFISLNHGWLAEALVTLDRVEEARRHAALAVRRARKGDRLGEAMAWRAVADAAIKTGDKVRALRYLDHADTVAAIRQSPHEADKNAGVRTAIIA